MATNTENHFFGFFPHALEAAENPPPHDPAEPEPLAAGATQCDEMQHFSKTLTPLAAPAGVGDSAAPTPEPQCNTMQHISRISHPPAAPNGHAPSLPARSPVAGRASKVNIGLRMRTADSVQNVRKRTPGVTLSLLSRPTLRKDVWKPQQSRNLWPRTLLVR